MKYTVEVTREGDAWLADIPSVRGAHTYGRNIPALRANIEEVVRLVCQLPASARVEQDWKFLNVDPAVVRATEIASERSHLDAKQTALASEMNHLVWDLAGKGFSMRDISGLLDVSLARVQQIAARTTVDESGRRVTATARESHKMPLTTVQALRPRFTVTQNYRRRGERALTVERLGVDETPDGPRHFAVFSTRDGEEVTIYDRDLGPGRMDIQVPKVGPIAEAMARMGRLDSEVR